MQDAYSDVLLVMQVCVLLSIHVYDVCAAVRLHCWLSKSQEMDNLQDVTAAL